jgi:hypothetical protein
MLYTLSSPFDQSLDGGSRDLNVCTLPRRTVTSVEFYDFPVGWRTQGSEEVSLRSGLVVFANQVQSGDFYADRLPIWPASEL